MADPPSYCRSKKEQYLGSIYRFYFPFVPPISCLRIINMWEETSSRAETFLIEARVFIFKRMIECNLNFCVQIVFDFRVQRVVHNLVSFNDMLSFGPNWLYPLGILRIHTCIFTRNTYQVSNPKFSILCQYPTHHRWIFHKFQLLKKL